MKRPTESEYQKLSKELGRLDKERRVVLQKIKDTPEYVTKHLTNLLTGFIAMGQWFSNTNAKQEQSFFKLVGFKFAGKSDASEITKHGSALVKVDLEWDNYAYGSYVKTRTTENVTISVFNDIDKQILNGRKPTVLDEKKLVKAQLMDKKQKLKDQIKALELELKSI